MAGRGRPAQRRRRQSCRADAGAVQVEQRWRSAARSDRRPGAARQRRCGRAYSNGQCRRPSVNGQPPPVTRCQDVTQVAARCADRGTDYPAGTPDCRKPPQSGAPTGLDQRYLVHAQGRIVLVSIVGVAVLVGAVLGVGRWRGWFANPSVAAREITLRIRRSGRSPRTCGRRGAGVHPTDRAGHRAGHRADPVGLAAASTEVQTHQQYAPAVRAACWAHDLADLPWIAGVRLLHERVDNRIARLRLGEAPQPICRHPAAATTTAVASPSGRTACCTPAPGQATAPARRDIGYLSGNLRIW
jgi:hypothetical protein